MVGDCVLVVKQDGRVGDWCPKGVSRKLAGGFKGITGIQKRPGNDRIGGRDVCL